MNKGHNNDQNEQIETLKTLKSKLIMLSGYLITMRSDTVEEQKKMSQDLKILIKQVNLIKKNLGTYFTIILLFILFIVQKMLCSGTAIHTFFS